NPQTMNNFALHMDSIRASQIYEESSIIKNEKEISEISLKIKNIKNPVQLKFFQGPKGSKTYYVQRSDLKNIFLVNEDHELIPTFQDVVDKNLFEKSVEHLTSL